MFDVGVLGLDDAIVVYGLGEVEQSGMIVECGMNEVERSNVIVVMD